MYCVSTTGNRSLWTVSDDNLSVQVYLDTDGFHKNKPDVLRVGDEEQHKVYSQALTVPDDFCMLLIDSGGRSFFDPAVCIFLVPPQLFDVSQKPPHPSLSLI